MYDVAGYTRLAATASHYLSIMRYDNAMKGRQKVKTRKWHTKSTAEAEAREQLQNRPEKQGRLLDIAAQSDRELEPVGRLSG